MVGTKCFDVTDFGRNEVLGKVSDGKRRLAVRLFYPGEDDPLKKPVSVLNEEIAVFFGRLKADFSSYRERIRVYEDLKIREGTYPLILFSHGYGGCSEQNTDLCQCLAEHGYIVASVSHAFEAFETVYEDGSKAGFDKSLYRKMYSPFIPAYIDVLRMIKRKMSAEEAMNRFDRHQRKYERFTMSRIEEWVKDDRCVLQFIHELAEKEDSFLYHRIDFSHGVGVTGHSFGGAAAYRHCLEDEEISCGCDIDGALFGDHGEKINHKPFMLITGKNYNFVTRCLFYHDKPVHFIIFKDMEHMGFTDLKFAADKPKVFGKAAAGLVMDAMNAVHVEFFDRYLKKADTENMEKLPVSEEAFESYVVG